MKKPVLYIFSGLPGSGKSTLSKRLAQTLDAAHVRIDTIEQGLSDCGFGEVYSEGYELAYRITADILRSGCSAVADSVNPLLITRKAWVDVATSTQAEFKNIEVICSNTEEHQHRIEHRNNDVKNLKPTLWADVIAREYEAWNSPRIRIDTAGKKIDESVTELITALRS